MKPIICQHMSVVALSLLENIQLYMIYMYGILDLYEKIQFFLFVFIFCLSKTSMYVSISHDHFLHIRH